MAASLPNLEITGEHIPAPKNWTAKDECSEIIVQDSSDRLYETHDVETPYMVESWLKGNTVFLILVLFSLFRHLPRFH